MTWIDLEASGPHHRRILVLEFLHNLPRHELRTVFSKDSRENFVEPKIVQGGGREWSLHHACGYVFYMHMWTFSLKKSWLHSELYLVIAARLFGNVYGKCFGDFLSKFVKKNLYLEYCLESKNFPKRNTGTPKRTTGKVWYNIRHRMIFFF